MRAVVMAGGEGSRLRPLTSRRPKPLAPVANKPVMEHIIDLLRRHGITEIVATLHYLADEIESCFGDGSALGVNLRYVVEDSPLGTAGAIKLAEPHLAGEPFLVMSGDALTDLDLDALIEHHRARNADATITLQRVTNPLEFGVVVTDEDGRITRFLEKPSWGEVFSDTINTGIYVLEPAVLGYMRLGAICDFSKDLFPRMLREGKRLHGYVTTAYWTDIGNLQQYQQANYDALSGAVKVEMPGVQVAPGIWKGRNSVVDASASLTAPIVIGDNVTIEENATVTGPVALGNATIVTREANLCRTIAWEDCYFGEAATVTDATVADRNLVKDHVKINEGVVVGRGCTIGSGAVINPHLKLWPDKTVASGALVSMSLVYGIKWPGSLFGADGVSGLANIEITPEFAMKLGQAFGSHLKPGQRVITGRDPHPASRITNRCIISGLLSVGVHVQDVRSVPVPLSRYVTQISADGGVHTRVSPKNPNAFLIEFFDADGVNVDKTAERKIENLFFREDFRRTPMDQVGRLDFPSRSLERYTSDFLRALSPKALSGAGFRVVIDYAYGNAALVLPQILSNLGVEMIALNAYFDEQRVRTFREDRERHLQQLANIVKTLHANMGVLVDHDGETLALVDDRGRIIGRNRLLALLTLLVARSHRGARIAMPVIVPSAIEAIASANDATVVRTRSDRRSMLSLAVAEGKSLQFAAGPNYETVFAEFHPAFDALYAAAKTMELVAAEHRTLGDLVDELPEWHVASRQVPCPWERKGRIMRTLLDEHRSEDLDLTDGIRVQRNGGWVLVLPDASDPLFNVYAEGKSAEEAGDLVSTEAHRIEELAAVPAV